MKNELTFENWKDVVGFEGVYQVSDLGRVRSLKFGKKRIMNPYNSGGYLKIDLLKNGMRKKFFVHRLVLTAFLPNPKNRPQANHINEIKTDNRLENLEWCTIQYNIEYSSARTIEQFTKGGRLVGKFLSMNTAQRITGIDKAAISRVCRGERKTAGGFIWKFSDNKILPTMD